MRLTLHQKATNPKPCPVIVIGFSDSGMHSFEVGQQRFRCWAAPNTGFGHGSLFSGVGHQRLRIIMLGIIAIALASRLLCSSAGLCKPCSLECFLVILRAFIIEHIAITHVHLVHQFWPPSSPSFARSFFSATVDISSSLHKAGSPT